LNTTNDFWLIDSNFVGVMRFYKDRDNSDKYIDYKTFFLNKRKRDRWMWWRYWIHGLFVNRIFR